MNQINLEAFIREMTLIHHRFNRPISEQDPVAKQSIARYHAYISQHLNSNQFEKAAQEIFAKDEFFPTPHRFVEVATGATNRSLEAEWSKALNTMANYGNREGFKHLDDELQTVFRSGHRLWSRLAEANEYEKREVKREFISKLREARLSLSVHHPKELEKRKELAQ